MVQKICPHCKVIISCMPHTGDFVHTCNSGNPVLDNEDLIDLTNPNWNLQGVANQAPIRARIKGADVENRTKRGNPADTTRTRQHYQDIKI